MWIIGLMLLPIVLAPIVVLICYGISIWFRTLIDEHNLEWGPSSPREVARKKLIAEWKQSVDCLEPKE